MLLFPATVLPANGGSLHCKEQLVVYELADSPLNNSFALIARLFEIRAISAICNTELVDYLIVTLTLMSCHR
jgi:hypothetical protein